MRSITRKSANKKFRRSRRIKQNEKTYLRDGSTQRSYMQIFSDNQSRLSEERAFRLAEERVFRSAPAPAPIPTSKKCPLCRRKIVSIVNISVQNCPVCDENTSTGVETCNHPLCQNCYSLIRPTPDSDGKKKIKKTTKF
jgi:hypothetical protein